MTTYPPGTILVPGQAPILPKGAEDTVAEQEAEERALIEETLAAARTEAILAGVEPKTAARLAEAHRDRLEIVRYTSGPTVSVAIESGGKPTGREGARHLAQMIRERAHLESLGPDPVDLVADRLAHAGVPRAEARARAERRIWRETDGRIATRLPAGGDAIQGYGAGHLLYEEPALHHVTRQILAEVQAARQAPSIEALAAEKRTSVTYRPF
ncbi:MAG TPA: hypothetical protein VFS40_16010 [Gemmatimonadales bacterium]|nr:hypothetical protein [Gemmatimonadales bacterium]